MSTFKILITGAGLGGLTLAQSLRQSGIDCEIFERDGQPFERSQGYRLHLDADSLNAAREVLPDDLHALFQATAHFTEPYTTIIGQDLSVKKRLWTADDHGNAAWPAAEGNPIHANFDRAALRQILLAGLDDRIRYGKTLARYEQHPDRVVAHFADGSTAEGTVLVGADGIRSPVRRQRAPHAETMDAGISAIYGRIPMEVAAALVPSETLTDIFMIAWDERKLSLGLGTVRFPKRPDVAAARLSPTMPMQPQEDYVVCVLSGRHELFPSGLHAATSEDLQAIAAGMLTEWPARAATIVRAADTTGFFPVHMFTSVPCALDAPTNVTLLGDAIHAMTPTLGRGANLAMRDGVLLGRALRAVAAGETTLAEALSCYEREMLAYGYSVVREAAEVGRQRIGQNPLPT